MIDISQQDSVRLLEMNDGKVNFLSLPLRTALLAALSAADSDPSVEAVILAGRGKCFCAGMNVEDFDAGTALLAPSLHNEILDCLSEMTKPVIAAIHGGAHGGGLELALGCHYRVGLKGAKVSLPEVLVGMMPGARGTQHLPRAIGLAAAADMMLNGRRLPIEDAPTGLFDDVFEHDLLDQAKTFADRVAGHRPLPRLRDLTPANTGDDLSSLLPEDAPDYPGAVPAIEALYAAVNKPFTEAVAQAFASFSALKSSDVSKEFRVAFLAKLKAASEARRQKTAPDH